MVGIDAVYLFVYGTLKNGFYNHHLLKGSYIDNAVTVKKFTLLMDKYRIPYLIDSPHDHIMGELYLISPRYLKKLDIFENVPEYYYRREIRVRGGISAWAYFKKSIDPLELSKLLPISNYTHKLHLKYVPLHLRESSHISIRTRRSP